LSAFPGVSAARLTIDEDLEDASDATAIKTVLPLACEFERTGIPGVTLHTELTLGYLRRDQGIGGQPVRVFPAIGGLGLGFALGPYTTVRPVALVGYSLRFPYGRQRHHRLERRPRAGILSQAERGPAATGLSRARRHRRSPEPAGACRLPRLAARSRRWCHGRALR
jgi:hypothetical protein